MQKSWRKQQLTNTGFCQRMLENTLVNIVDMLSSTFFTIYVRMQVKSGKTAQHIYECFRAPSLNAASYGPYRSKAYDGSHLIIQLKRKKKKQNQDSFWFGRAFLSRIAFHAPSPISTSPSTTVMPTVRCIPPICSEDEVAWIIVTRIPAIINPPLTKSNMDTVFEGTFLLIMNAITDIITGAAPKIVPRTSSPKGKKPVPLIPCGELTDAIKTSAP